ncbi:MAG TPA: SCO family protein [Anaerolineales bacterium]|nr:SCO family protein [Anaerolineales bacterium]
MEKKFLWVGTGILLLVVLATATTIFLVRANQTLHGSVINPASPAPDFSLTNQTGGTVKMSDYRGKYVLLFFGYSHCTSECPATMAILAKARSLLGDQAQDVQVLFVATDPVGDTPQSVGEFLARFDPTFMGATGTLAELQPVWAAYGVTVEDGGETHSSYTYLIDPAGNLRMTYSYPGNPDDIAADLRLLFRKN